MLRVDGKEYYSTKEAAVRLGRTLSAVQDAIRRGSLRPTRFPGITNRVFIDAVEVERYEVEHHGSQGWGTRKAPDYVPDVKRSEYQRAYRERKRAAESGVPYAVRSRGRQEEAPDHTGVSE